MFNAPRPTQAYGVSSTTSFGGSFVDENPLAASTYDVPSIFTNAIGTQTRATVPAIYQQSFSTVDPNNTGETSVNSLSRVLSTSSLPATTVDKIVNLVSTRPRVSKLEFFVALALVALAQAGRDVSVEQVALLAQQNTLPEPTLDISLLSYGTAPSSTLGLGHPSGGSGSTTLRNSPAVVPPTDDPWTTGRFGAGTSSPHPFGALRAPGCPLAGGRRQEKVTIQFGGQQGFVLNRYMVYAITTERGGTVQRRYSEFVFLWDCLIRRYPFRLLPQLPPKRIGPDESFLEQRRKGLERFLRVVMNHPEPSFEQWRRHSSISLEEESASKRIDRVEEMTIPSDLEDKLGHVRHKIAPLIEAWQKICVLGERLIRKREAAAVRSTSTRPSLMPHLRLPSALRIFSPPLLSSNDADPTWYATGLTRIFFPPREPCPADLSRLTNTLKTLVEVNGQCWKGDDCDLSQGVKQGVVALSAHTQRHTDLLELRTGVLLQNTLEELKSQRDLYIAMRDLFKRVDANALKLESIKALAKDGWEEEADKIAGSIEKDKATISAQLNRRVFIRACCAVVLHNRESTLLTQLVQSFAREEQEFADAVAANWASLSQAVEVMPFE
ncbi:hypothetical protein H4582DRAFT_2110825 [Lactarius indigo]|nr:hypothetical protein H4582DRAFT_2110825 [Lactarius indigo]